MSDLQSREPSYLTRTRKYAKVERVTPTITITDDDKYMFEHGDCHTLALAIHHLTGWQLAALGEPDEACGGHAFVVTPSGQALDIRGQRPMEALLKQYRDRTWSPHNVASIDHEFGGAYEDNAPARAKALAVHLVAGVLDRNPSV